MAKRAARKKAATKKWQKHAAQLLVALLLACVAFAALLAFPELEDYLYQVTGIADTAAVPGTNVDSPTAVHFISVGQGDAVLVQQDGEFALIDAGPPEGKESLLAYLHANGITELRYVFMSHAHADHIGAMQAVMEAFQVNTVVLPDFTIVPSPTSNLFVTLLQSLESSAQYTQTAQLGEVYALGRGSFTVLQAGVQGDNLNLQSLVLMFEAEGMRFLTTGDAEKENEQALLASGAAISATLFKAGHHGSSTSNTLDFMRAVRPAVVVICCGAENSYGHPHTQPLENFAAVGATVLRTDTMGNIVVQPDGQGGLVYAYSEETAAA